MLHVAPEPCLEHRFKRLAGMSYLSADLLDSRAMIEMDVTDIQFPDQQFDLIYCSHVLEHVPNDRKAMAEFRRVLKKDGWAILSVPVMRDETYEDSTITDPEARLRAFGQEDHVRIYGKDYVERLREAGFEVQVINVKEFVDSIEIESMRLMADEDIYLCKR